MRDILAIAAPFTLWIAAFSGVYGLEGLVCSRHGLALGPGEGRLVLLAAGLGAAALQAGLLWTLRGPAHGAATRFGRTVSLTLGVAGLAATLWTLIPVLTLPLCHG